MTQLVFGEAVDVLSERRAWVEIRTGYGYPGWVQSGELASDDPLTEAKAYVGAPYEWGGMTAEGIDCSGLVHMAFRRAGTIVPRDADQQEEAGERVEPHDAGPGDLVTYGEGRADHIAFWLGDGTILHATGREDACAVVLEREPDDLRARRRFFVRLAPHGAGSRFGSARSPDLGSGSG